MYFGPVYTVSDARAQLPALIASTRTGETPVIGGHRKREAVLMSAGLLDVYDLLLHGMARDEANDMLNGRGLKRGDVIHPGDPVGKVIAWLWLSAQRPQLVSFVTTIIAQLRHWGRDTPEPRLRLADLLDGIPMALPNGFPREEVEPLLDYLRDAVPLSFSDDPNSP